jgi:hypothetical protein
MDNTAFGIEIITSGALDEERWRRVLRLQCQWSELTPQRYGEHEPIRKPFDIERLDEVVHEVWSSSDSPIDALYWKNGQSRLWGIIRRGFAMPGFGGVSVRNSGPAPRQQSRQQLVGFPHAIASRVCTVFGFVHQLAEPEIERWRGEAGVVTGGDGSGGLMMMCTPMDLRRRVPDLFWGTVFGLPYVRLFGREKLLSSPAFLVKELAPSTVYVQLTESLEDMLTRFEHVDRVRQEVKRHLEVDAFWRPDSGDDHRYQVPDVFMDEEE